MEVLVFIFMGMAALVGGLLFTTFAVKGVVFGGKDNDLLFWMRRTVTAEKAIDKKQIQGVSMNEKFFTLPEEKQKRIINAAYVVFGWLGSCRTG